MTNQVADDTVAFCPSCKKDMTHTITSVEEEKIKKVVCKTCKDEHDYQVAGESNTPARKKKTTKRASASKSISPAEEWEKMMQQNQNLPAKPYTFDGRFAAGEKVDHATFGIGLVKSLVSPNKMEVLFKEGIKLLIWGRTLP